MSAYELSPDAAHAVLDDGAVVLNLRTKRYYALNETGSVIWSLLESGMPLSEIAEQLVTEYAIGIEEAEAALGRLMGALAREGLVSASAADEPIGSGR